MSDPILNFSLLLDEVVHVEMDKVTNMVPEGNEPVVLDSNLVRALMWVSEEKERNGQSACMQLKLDYVVKQFCPFRNMIFVLF